MSLKISEFLDVAKIGSELLAIPDGPPSRVTTAAGLYTVGAGTFILRVEGTGFITWPGSSTAEFFDGVEYRRAREGDQFGVSEFEPVIPTADLNVPFGGSAIIPVALDGVVGDVTLNVPAASGGLFERQVATSVPQVQSWPNMSLSPVSHVVESGVVDMGALFRTGSGFTAVDDSGGTTGTATGVKFTSKFDNLRSPNLIANGGVTEAEIFADGDGKVGVFEFEIMFPSSATISGAYLIVFADPTVTSSSRWVLTGNSGANGGTLSLSYVKADGSGNLVSLTSSFFTKDVKHKMRVYVSRTGANYIYGIDRWDGSAWNAIATSPTVTEGPAFRAGTRLFINTNQAGSGVGSAGGIIYSLKTIFGKPAGLGWAALASGTVTTTEADAEGGNFRYRDIAGVPATPGILTIRANGGTVGQDFNVIVAAIPTNTALPTISASSVEEGRTFTATNGSWDGSPTTYSYQWQRKVGSVWTDIAGATAGTYVAAVADVGNEIRSAVRATNAFGTSERVFSASSGPVAAASGWGAPGKPGIPTAERAAASTVAGYSLTLTPKTTGEDEGFPSGYPTSAQSFTAWSLLADQTHTPSGKRWKVWAADAPQWPIDILLFESVSDPGSDIVMISGDPIRNGNFYDGVLNQIKDRQGNVLGNSSATVKQDSVGRWAFTVSGFEKGGVARPFKKNQSSTETVSTARFYPSTPWFATTTAVPYVAAAVLAQMKAARTLSVNQNGDRIDGAGSLTPGVGHTNPLIYLDPSATFTYDNGLTTGSNKWRLVDVGGTAGDYWMGRSPITALEAEIREQIATASTVAPDVIWQHQSSLFNAARYPGNFFWDKSVGAMCDSQRGPHPYLCHSTGLLSGYGHNVYKYQFANWPSMAISHGMNGAADMYVATGCPLFAMMQEGIIHQRLADERAQRGRINAVGGSYAGYKPPTNGTIDRAESWSYIATVHMLAQLESDLATFGVGPRSKFENMLEQFRLAPDGVADRVARRDAMTPTIMAAGGYTLVDQSLVISKFLGGTNLSSFDFTYNAGGNQPGSELPLRDSMLMAEYHLQALIHVSLYSPNFVPYLNRQLRYCWNLLTIRGAKMTTNMRIGPQLVAGTDFRTNLPGGVMTIGAFHDYIVAEGDYHPITAAAPGDTRLATSVTRAAHAARTLSELGIRSGIDLTAADDLYGLFEPWFGEGPTGIYTWGNYTILDETLVDL